jgi:hypothetical protein
MAKVDLVVISAGVKLEALAPAWLYIPRMLGDPSLVVHERSTASAGPVGFRVVSARQVEELAARAAALRAA